MFSASSNTLCTININIWPIEIKWDGKKTKISYYNGMRWILMTFANSIWCTGQWTNNQRWRPLTGSRFRITYISACRPDSNEITKAVSMFSGLYRQFVHTLFDIMSVTGPVLWSLPLVARVKCRKMRECTLSWRLDECTMKATKRPLHKLYVYASCSNYIYSYIYIYIWRNCRERSASSPCPLYAVFNVNRLHGRIYNGRTWADDQDGMSHVINLKDGRSVDQWNVDNTDLHGWVWYVFELGPDMAGWLSLIPRPCIGHWSPAMHSGLVPLTDSLPRRFHGINPD